MFLELSYSVRSWLYVPVYCDKCLVVWRLVIMQLLERNRAVLNDAFNTNINRFSCLPTLKCLVLSNNVFFSCSLTETRKVMQICCAAVAVYVSRC